MSFAKIALLGNIGQDATVKEINGRYVINFSVAHNEKYTDGAGIKHEKTTWFNCALWKDSREKTRVAEYLKAGQIVHVEGEPEVRLFEGKNGKSAALNVTVSQINFAGASPAGRTQAAPEPEPAGAVAGYDANAGMKPADDDLPF